MAVNENTPSSYSVSQVNLNLLTTSAAIEMYANAPIDVDKTLYDRYGKDVLGIQGLMDELGQTRAVTSNVYQHYEKDWRDEIIRVTSSYTSGSATATLTVNSSYNASYPNPTTQTFYTSATATYAVTPRVGDIIEASEVKMLVTSVTNASTSTFNVECMQTGDTVPAGLADVEIFIIGRSEAEGGSTPINREVTYLKYENKIQNLSDAYKVTGNALGQTSLINSSTGEPYYWIEGALETRRRFEDNVNLTLFTGEKITSTSSTFAARNTTEGLIPFIQNNGNTEAYTVTSFSLQDLENAALTLGKYDGAAENMLLTSQSLQIEIDNLLRTSEGLKAGGVSYDKMADFGFDAVTYGGVTWYFKTLRALSNIKNLGSANSQYKNMGVSIPMGNTTAFDYGKEKITTPSLVLNYLDVKGENNGYKEWVTGGAGLASTDDTDTMKLNMRKRIGFEAFCPNRYLLFEA